MAMNESQQTSPQNGAKQVPGASTSALNRTDVMGKALYGQSGGKVGNIEDVVTNEQGHVVTALVGVGGFLGIGEKKVGVPAEQLKPEGNRIVVSGLSADEVRDMPAYNPPSATQ
jgi:sporulation protein YlmC with PRC-barrel domain